MVARWISSVVLVGAGFVGGVLTHDGWWVVGGVVLGAVVDRMVRRHQDAAGQPGDSAS